MKHPLQTILETADINVRPYSGRGMYGRACVGVVVGSGELGDLIGKIIHGVLDLQHDDVDGDGQESRDARDVADAMYSFSMDQLGLDQIVYWSDIQYTEAADQDESEDNESDQVK